MNEKYITISQLNRYLKYKFDNDTNLLNVSLKGEISNFKAHTRGHLYFTLKDENSRINAIMFSSNTSHLPFTPVDGMKVLVTGKISIYEATGNYQIYIDEMMEDGIGNLYIAFEQLKKKLAGEGLFDQAKKKSIPRIPNKIGIITASTGAAIKDILSTLKRRWPLVETILFPSLVQGNEAAKDIVKNINKAESYDLDVLIIGRGGGSIEDLWPFNEEIVARSIANCKIPVISAVGHEIDFTIADFVADLRAPTPTAAAELAVPNKNDVHDSLLNIKIRLNKAITNKLKLNWEKLNNFKRSYTLQNPKNIFIIKEQYFDNIFERLKNSMLNITSKKQDLLLRIKDNYIFRNPKQIYQEQKKRYAHLLDSLNTLNPINTIKRGYSITRKNNVCINSVKNIKVDDLIEVEMLDGLLITKVIERKKKNG